MWFKVDDQLHDHRKARKAGKAAMGVWVLAGSWSADNGTDGFVPDDVLPRWGNRRDANQLVSVGLWSEEVREFERGWLFNDWEFWQPSAVVTAQVKAKEREAGLRGNHKRWHADRGITDPLCEYCYRVPDQEPDRDPDAYSIGGGESGSDRPVPEPEPEATSNEVAGGGKRRTTKRGSQLPDGWMPNEQGRQLARENALAATELEKFRTFHQAKGSTMKDWDAAWRNWVLKAVEYAKPRQPQMAEVRHLPSGDIDPTSLPPVESSWMRRSPS